MTVRLGDAALRCGEPLAPGGQARRAYTAAAALAAAADDERVARLLRSSIFAAVLDDVAGGESFEAAFTERVGAAPSAWFEEWMRDVLAGQ